MRRIGNWDRALIRKAVSLKGRDFVWGETDCATISIICINEMYPEPAINAHIGSLRDASTLSDPEAVKTILSDSGGLLVPPGMVSCGDVVWGERDDPDGLPSFGVCLRGGKMITSSREVGVVVADIGSKEDIKVYRMPQ